MAVAAHYPEITRAGSLTKLLRTELLQHLDQQHCAFLVERPQLPPPLHVQYYACCRRGHRHGDIVCASRERLFLASFWEQGVWLAKQSTASLDTLVRALLTWYVQSASASMLQRVNEVAVADAAPFYEAGPAAYVEHRWQQLLTEPGDLPGLNQLVWAAAARAQLRRLMPYKSLYWLGFSRCTGYPFTRDCPAIGQTSDGRFEVRDSRHRKLARVPLEEALDILVSNLPPGADSAVHGTADRLANTPGTHLSGGCQPK
jgi:hypothetical protein